ncbi:MAG: hypothetical protein MJZ83_02765 [Bacteroidaceae bacterium]|nr:hypothetical protein [Bacteroidaceae bacterium]
MMNLLLIQTTEVPDTLTLVKNLQSEVLKLTWTNTLNRVEIEFLLLFCLLLLFGLIMLYFYMHRKQKMAVQKERRIRVIQEAHYRNAQLYEEGNQKKAKQLELTRLFHCARSEELRVTQEDWADLQSYISEQFPKLIPALYEKVPKLTEIELQISMLVKINVSITDIAYLVNRTKQAITVSRARLYKKITGEEGTADQFDNWIGSF